MDDPDTSEDTASAAIIAWVAVNLCLASLFGWLVTIESKRTPTQVLSMPAVTPLPNAKISADASAPLVPMPQARVTVWQPPVINSGSTDTSP